MTKERRIKLAQMLTDALAEATDRFRDEHGELEEDRFGIAIIIGSPSGQSVVRSPGFTRENCAHVLGHVIEDLRVLPSQKPH